MRETENDPRSPFLQYARIECSTCHEEGGLRLAKRLPSDIIDKKFLQMGWRLDPHVCPTCQTKGKVRNDNHPEKQRPEPVKPAKVTEKMEDMQMGIAGSALAIKAQVKLVRLLEDHYDAESGAYNNQYSDERIAEETGLALGVVEMYRREAYGDLAPPHEISDMTEKLNDLQKRIGKAFDDALALAREEHAAALKEIGAMRETLAKAMKEYKR